MLSLLVFSFSNKFNSVQTEFYDFKFLKNYLKQTFSFLFLLFVGIL